MPRRTPKKISAPEVLHDFQKVEPNFEYWMEHVVHWHALLFAVVTVLSLGYLLLSQQHALASWPG